MVLKRVEPFSWAKINGAIAAVFGLLIGFFASVGAVFVGLFSSQMTGSAEGGLFATLFGIGAIIFMPIFYGGIGFIGGLISAWLYNLMAGWIGGIELEFEQPASSAPPQQF